MNELDRRGFIIYITRQLRILADLNYDTQDVDFAGETLVHEFLRSVHNAIVYVRGVRGVTESLDNWERRHGRGPISVGAPKIEYAKEAMIEHSLAADRAVTEIMTMWAHADIGYWQDCSRVAITHLNVEEQNRLDDNVTLLYFLF